MGTRFENLFRVPPAAGPLRDAWPLRTFLKLAPLPTAVPSAGLHARLVVSEWRLDRLGDMAEAAVETLVSSAVQVCAQAPDRPPLHLRLSCDGVRVMAVVRDVSTRPPAKSIAGTENRASHLAATGHCAADWGWMPVPGGKLCWCLMS
jgi:hypothetical protein